MLCFKAKDRIRDVGRSRGLGDGYKRQPCSGMGMSSGRLAGIGPTNYRNRSFGAWVSFSGLANRYEGLANRYDDYGQKIQGAHVSLPQIQKSKDRLHPLPVTDTYVMLPSIAYLQMLLASALPLI